jgi:uncharacterized protein (UPF0332 family)
MAFPDDLLQQAKQLANRERKRPKQASLRRAVSTAYYALFHLLISEATLNWRIPAQRPTLARFFKHGEMKTASDKHRTRQKLFMDANPHPGAEFDCATRLHQVADTFFQTQEDRHTADYDNAKRWTRTEALAVISRVEAAFQSWNAVRGEPAAQEYLLSLFGRPPGHG